ncbi:MAG: hypothetical protein NZ899_06540 [Thermoguttaceae bacterium]|nr:hypothetical protein [Thermoguttaceae bacterium]MDW8079180.1 hypothetical protein [Thermoguttaceae bacterium]
MSLSLGGTVFCQLCARWEQKTSASAFVDSYSLRYYWPMEPSSADGMWVVDSGQLSAGQSQLWELDLLPREVFGRLIYLSFSQIKLLWIVNKRESQGQLHIAQAPENGWIGPWSSGSALLLPPGSPLILAYPGAGWPVRPHQAAIVLSAIGGKVVYELALLGTVAAAGSSPSGGSASGSQSPSDLEGSSSSSGQSSSSFSGGTSGGESSAPSSSWESSSSDDESFWS